MIELKPVEETYQEILDKLKYNIPFSFSRFGDGEFNCILGKSINGLPSENCDGHTYFADLGARLMSIIQSNPSYMMGIQPMCLRGAFANEINFIIERQSNIDWINADVLHKASIRGDLQRFFDILATKQPLIIGPRHLYALKGFWFMTIKDKDCWLDYSEIKESLQHVLRDACHKMVICFCASMMSNVLIDDMYKEFGELHTFLDIGSLFDPYCGLKSRKYHHNLIINGKD